MNCWKAKYLCIRQSAAKPKKRLRKVQRLSGSTRPCWVKHC